MARFAFSSPSCLFLLIIISSVESKNTDFDSVKEWAASFAQKLVDDLNDVSRYDEVRKSYPSNVAASATTDEVDYRSQLKSTVESVENLLRSRVEALDVASNEAETLVSAHSFADSSPDSLFQDSDPSLNSSYDSRFGRDVSDASRMHKPLDVYRGWAPVVHAVNWTSDLDHVWRANAANQRDIGWQYFASTSGVVRYFPGADWPTEHLKVVDTFDVRRRPSYSVGASYPKNMLILIDTSGSVKGQTLELLIFTVKSLLDTLDGNDYVHVARFPPAEASDDDDDDDPSTDPSSSESLAVVDCFQGLVQATTQNKRLIADALNDLEPHGMADFKQAFNYAFDTLHRFDKKVEGDSDNERGACCPNQPNARCNKMIMVLTDALTDSPTELLRDRNADGNVKVFTYAMGLAARDQDKLKLLACEHGGDYRDIVSTEAVRRETQEYLGALSLPRKKGARWTPAYPDGITGKYTISATVPVFDGSNGMDPNVGQKMFHGVAGVDVFVSELRNLLPLEMLGRSSLAFILDGNGDVIYSGTLSSDVEEYMERIHGIAEVDFLYLWSKPEGNDTLLEDLRKDILSGSERTGAEVTCLPRSLSSSSSLSAMTHVQCDSRRFFFSSVADTPYSLGFAVVGESLETSGVLAGDNLTKFHDAASNVSVFPNGDFPAVFLQAYDGSSIKVSPKGSEISVSVDSIARAESLAHDDGDSWTFIPPSHSSSSVVAIRPVFAPSSSNFVPSVVGAGVNDSYLRTLMRDHVNGGQLSCDDEATGTHCYLLDDGGYVIYSNQDVDLGQFFGRHEPELMSTLISHDIFRKFDHYDFRASCIVLNRFVNAAPRPYARAFLLGNVFELFSKPWILLGEIATAFWANMNFYSTFASFLTSPFSTGHGAIYASNDDEPEFVPCVKNMSLYTYGSRIEESNNFLSAEIVPKSITPGCNCNWTLAVTRLAKTNLLLVVARSDPRCVDRDCPPEKIPREPIEDVENRGASCGADGKLKEAPFRRRPSRCGVGGGNADAKRPAAIDCTSGTLGFFSRKDAFYLTLPTSYFVAFALSS